MNRQDFIKWCGADHAALRSRSGYAPLIMGVLNVTPDSFYDGGRYRDVHAAYDHAQAMIAAGADLLDVGGEASNPGALPVSIQQELDRVLPILERITASDSIALSVDTYKPQVMQAAIAAGVACINDIYAMQHPGAIDCVQPSDVTICLMHMQGTPQTMQHAPHYQQDVVEDIDVFFAKRIAACAEGGIHRSRLIVDPGFGFGKTVPHNLKLVQRIAQFQGHDVPVMLGVSRKATIGKILDQPPAGRMVGGLALAVYAMLSGVSIIRTHDVLETRQAFKILQDMRSVGVVV